MRTKYACIGCTGGCTLIVDTLDVILNINALPTNCFNDTCCSWKEITGTANYDLNIAHRIQLLLDEWGEYGEDRKAILADILREMKAED